MQKKQAVVADFVKNTVAFFENFVSHFVMSYSFGLIDNWLRFCRINSDYNAFFAHWSAT